MLASTWTTTLFRTTTLSLLYTYSTLWSHIAPKRWHVSGGGLWSASSAVWTFLCALAKGGQHVTVSIHHMPMLCHVNCHSWYTQKLGNLCPRKGHRWEVLQLLFSYIKFRLSWSIKSSIALHLKGRFPSSSQRWLVSGQSVLAIHSQYCEWRLIISLIAVGSTWQFPHCLHLIQWNLN